MSNIFNMTIEPGYQYRTTKRGCSCCGQPVRPGERVMLGTVWYAVNGSPRRRVHRYHYDCFRAVLEAEVEDWFHKNPYKPERTPYSKTKRLQIGKLNNRLWNLRKKGVDEDDPRIQIILQRKEELQGNNINIRKENIINGTT